MCSIDEQKILNIVVLNVEQKLFEIGALKWYYNNVIRLVCQKFRETQDWIIIPVDDSL